MRGGSDRLRNNTGIDRLDKTEIVEKTQHLLATICGRTFFTGHEEGGNYNRDLSVAFDAPAKDSVALIENINTFLLTSGLTPIPPGKEPVSVAELVEAGQKEYVSVLLLVKQFLEGANGDDGLRVLKTINARMSYFRDERGTNYDPVTEARRALEGLRAMRADLWALIDGTSESTTIQPGWKV